QRAAALKRAAPVLHILRHIDDDWTGPARPSDLERSAHGRLELRRIGHEEHVLRDRAHDARDWRFLKRVAADRGSRHLTAYDDDRDRIGHAIAYGRDGVRRSRPGSHDANADLSGGASVACGHEPRALLV